MKFSIALMLLAIAVTFAATIPLSLEQNGNNITSASSLLPHTGQIYVELGMRGSNIGTLKGNDLRDRIISLLRTACPDSTLQECNHGVAYTTVDGQIPDLQWPDNRPRPTLEKLGLEIYMSYYAGIREVYDVLMDAVAAAAVAGTLENCIYWKDTTACYTHDRITVLFHGYWMFVAIEASKGQYFDCWKGRQLVEDAVREFQPRMEKVSSDGDLYVVSECY